MKLGIRLLCGILAWITTGWGPALGDATIPTVRDLTLDARTAQTRQVPILVLFMSPDCSYCERVLQEFLLPMQRNAEYRSKVVMRQVDIGSDDNLRDFSGATTTQATFAGRNKVQMVPTIKLFDAQGRELTQPLVGLSTPDFYGGYLDQAIDDALAKVRAEKGARR
jgi:thioredoxin-related protein